MAIEIGETIVKICGDKTYEGIVVDIFKDADGKMKYRARGEVVFVGEIKTYVDKRIPKINYDRGKY